MSMYKVTISGVFDSDIISNNSDKLILHLVRNCCPSFFGFNVGEACGMSNCIGCWEHALERGARADAAENVHVERLG